MKRKSDPRHIKRIKLMQELFTWDFGVNKKISRDTKEVVGSLKDIDKKIGDCAPDRPIKEINKIDLAILRLAVFEIIIKEGIPPKVAIDEAVELAKEYGGESSPSFINGVLGKLLEKT